MFDIFKRNRKDRKKVDGGYTTSTETRPSYASRDDILSNTLTSDSSSGCDHNLQDEIQHLQDAIRHLQDAIQHFRGAIKDYL